MNEPPGRPAGRAHALAVVLGYCALFSLFFLPVLLSGRSLAPGDGTIFFFPHFAGERFGWNPYLHSGFPLLADPQAQHWYAPARLLSAIPGSWNAFVISAYVLAACFAYGYAYRLTASPLAASVAGLVYGMSGFLVAHLGHVSLIHSAAWIPLVFWALEGLRESGSGRWVALLALAFAGCLLGGHPQLFVYPVFLAACYVLYLGPRAGGRNRAAQGCEEREAPGRLRFGGLALGGLVLGCGLGGVLLLPLSELAGLSVRADLSYREFMTHSLRFEQLPRLLFPHIYGGWHGAGETIGSLPYFARVPIAEVTGFVGLVPLLLAWVGFRCNRGRPLARFWAVVAVVALLLSLGRHFPVSSLLYFVPVYDKFRIMPRHLVEVALAVSVLSSFGVASLSRIDAGERRRRIAATGGLLAAACVLALLLFLAVVFGGHWEKYLARAGVVPGQVVPWRNPLVGLQLAAGALAFAALWRWASRPSRVGALLLVLAIALELASFGFFSEWRSSPVSEEVFAFPAGLAPYREALARESARATPLSFRGPREAVPPNRNLLWKMPSTMGYGPLVLDRYADLLGIGPYELRSFEVLDAEHRGLDLLASRYLFLPSSWLQPGSPEPRSAELRRRLEGSERWRRAPDLPATAVFENRRALPRAWLVGEVVVATPGEILAAIRSSRLPDGRLFEPQRVALVEASPAEQPGCGLDCGRVEILALEAEHVALRTHAPSSAFLVSSEIFYPGWRLRIDGEPAAIERVDYCLRGVLVPAGEHELHFDFAPRRRSVGKAISLASLALVLLLARGPSLARFGRRSGADR